MISEEIYRENILDHFKRPHNHGVLESFSVRRKEYNPTCGDVIEVDLLIDSSKVVDVRFKGEGCAISQAAASMLTDEIKGKEIKEVMKFSQQNVLELLGIPISATRMKCAMLGLRAVERAVVQYGP